MLNLLIELGLTYIATITFGVLLNVPRTSLNIGGWIGVLSFLAYRLCMMADMGIAIANLVGALVIGILSMQAARYKKMPVINFNIPALVPFVPGGQAYQMIKNFALGDVSTAISFLLQVTIIAGSIAFGLLLAEMVNRLQSKLMVIFSSRWSRDNRRNPKL
ncbi:threonine/serine exporter family protein [Secundilactobacillus mixtipabuli]|uniref:Membrane protein n=1 Tax=Secundilactobacillus mixtipabuli TaxID=1435342 RepID=A0A1Z5ICB2_9LACO|nr:threonine/serine exporter family protein [Secundilactobacillus mixtipabuli]GAW99288.1 membrane protein [Secundilactobacillus mixtipabuli]